MKRTVITAWIVLAAGAALADGSPHWGYTGDEGPAHWGGLAPEYAVCGTGKNQSPVDLAGLTDAELEPVVFHYRAGAGMILNNGHTIRLDQAAGSTIAVNGHEYELKQFHFHAPGENRIDGHAYPMEAHLVHEDRVGNLAVIAVMFEEGVPNPALEQAWAELPGRAGESRTLPAAVDVRALLPASRDYYRYNGSLTTPPCTEGVLWLVMKQPLTVSRAQIEAFAHAMHHPNNRPLEPLNARTVLR
jgi:carbonic anhydrase